jgi:hypothetical protein
MDKKKRTRVPPEIADEVMFVSNRTCCVCRKEGVPVQIHHIDENPSNNSIDNLAVLCFVCHEQTQIKGGFGRKLNAGLVRRFRDEWHGIAKTIKEQSDIGSGGDGGNIFIVTRKLSGNGTITADGGSGFVGGNAGSIHIHADQNNYLGEISAKGGVSSNFHKSDLVLYRKILSMIHSGIRDAARRDDYIRQHSNLLIQPLHDYIEYMETHPVDSIFFDSALQILKKRLDSSIKAFVDVLAENTFLEITESGEYSYAMSQEWKRTPHLYDQAVLKISRHCELFIGAFDKLHRACREKFEK